MESTLLPSVIRENPSPRSDPWFPLPFLPTIFPFLRGLLCLSLLPSPEKRGGGEGKVINCPSSILSFSLQTNKVCSCNLDVSLIKFTFYRNFSGQCIAWNMCSFRLHESGKNNKNSSRTPVPWLVLLWPVRLLLSFLGLRSGELLAFPHP